MGIMGPTSEESGSMRSAGSQELAEGERRYEEAEPHSAGSRGNHTQTSNGKDGSNLPPHDEGRHSSNSNERGGSREATDILRRSDIDAFFYKFSLSETSKDIFFQLQNHVQDKITQTFTQSNTSPDSIDEQFTRYARKTALAMFIEKYQLDQVSQDFLHKYGRGQAGIHVTNTFKPSLPEGEDVNHLFMSFAKKKLRPRSEDDDREIVKAPYVSHEKLRSRSEDDDRDIVKAPYVSTSNSNSPSRSRPTSGVSAESGIVKAPYLTGVPEAGTYESDNRSGGRISGIQKEDMREFIRRWSLDAHSVSVLEGMKPEQAAQVMTEFRPSRAATVDNFNPKFVSFCRSRTGAHHPYHGPMHGHGPKPDAPGGHHVNVPPSSLPPLNARNSDAVAEFCRRFSLDKRCEDALKGLPIGVRQTVIQEFRPRKDQDPVRMFFAFMRSRSSMENAEPHFIRRFNLDDTAKNLLYALNESLRKEVMETFAPKNPDGNMNPVFMSFAKSMRVKADSKNYGHAARAHAHAHDNHHTTKHDTHRGSHVSTSGGGKYGSGSSGGNRDVDRFIRQWELSGECEKELRKYDDKAQEILMKEFNPIDTSRNASRLFLAYLQSKAPRATVLASQDNRKESRYGPQDRLPISRNGADAGRSGTSRTMSVSGGGITSTAIVPTTRGPPASTAKMGPPPHVRRPSGSSSTHGGIGGDSHSHSHSHHAHEQHLGSSSRRGSNTIRPGEPIGKPYDERKCRPVRVPRRDDPPPREKTSSRREENSRRHAHNGTEEKTDDKSRREENNSRRHTTHSSTDDKDDKSRRDGESRRGDAESRRGDAESDNKRRDEEKRKTTGRRESAVKIKPEERGGSKKSSTGRRGSEDSEQMAVVKKFASRHKLNSKATSVLNSLTTGEQNMMMVHFDPDQRRETSNQFISLVERKTKRKVREEDSPERRSKVARTESSRHTESRRHTESSRSKKELDRKH